MATFFEHQDVARRNTKILVLLYVLAVAAVIIAVDIVLAVTWLATGNVDATLQYASTQSLLRAVPASVYLWGALGTAGVIFLVSAWNVSKLGGGGAAVAQMVGARRVEPGTRDLLERRLLNVVEEMAIASGVRVPAVYVMDGEGGINAFAAGWEVSNSVVAVTRGTLETLNRDELQGVVAHEFSHILNGDMRLNIRMIGVLAGIVFIGSIGEFLLRSQRGGSSSKNSGSGYFVVVGLALMLIGWIGLFFSRLIKAAVSRQREFLADASAVQFTRNPDGVAGALDRIRNTSRGTLVENRHAEDLSHMFFADSVKVWFGGLFDTHPPIEERIARAHPRFQPSTYRQKRPPTEPTDAEAAKAGLKKEEAAKAIVFGAAAALGGEGRRGGDLGTQWGRSAKDSAALVGTVDGGKVDYARRLLKALPDGLRDKLHDPDGARAALVAMLLAPAEDVLQGQLAALKAAGLDKLSGDAAALLPLTRRLGPAFHLPAIDLALPAVKASPQATHDELIKALEIAVQADRRVSLHEFVVLTLVRDQLVHRPRGPAPAGRRIAELGAEARLLLSLIAHAGTRQDATGRRGEALQAAIDAGAKEMSLAPATAAGVAGELTLNKAGAALAALKALAPMQKAVLIKGLFATVSHDGSIRLAEAELMRLAGAVLDCPLPPLLETIDPATLME
ncbi:MAG: M48 family metallopeptidase [Betaproteobacteria bacterium]